MRVTPNVPTPGEEALAKAIATSDVLRRVAGTAAIHIYEARYSPDGSYVCTAFLGAGLESLLGPIPAGMDEEEAWERAVHQDDRPLYDEFSLACQRAEPAEVEFRLVGYDGVTRWVWERGRPRRDGGVVYVDGVVADITERRRAADALADAQAELRHLAYHDSLTGLPNRLLFHEHLGKALQKAERDGHAAAVLFVDLDDFKLVNDSFGHSVGDEVLREVAGRLQSAVRASDVVARLGGDEFLVLIHDVDAEREGIDRVAELVAEKIGAALETPFTIVHADAGTEVYVTASIGLSVFPMDAQDADGMLRHADIAMYHAKESARGGDEAYHRSEGGDRAARLSTAGRLRKAIDRGEMVLHYQPLVELKSGALVGVEALIRWQDGPRGLVLPGDFLPLAERTGLIVPISEWVINEACRQACDWAERGLDLYVSVNMPPAMWRPTATRHLLDALQSFGLNADRLMIELTESAAMANRAHIEPAMAELHERGLRLAIDDFGTGHSSLSRLAQMRVTTLKIDRSFVRDLSANSGTAVLVRAIVQLALNLGLQPLAEGIETEGQRAFLLSHGCQLGQGFLFSPAVPAPQIEALCRARGRAGGRRAA
jgi:diguanylate cyclase (GGDEF)-like protein/PAS domain S-box-containing protein